MQAMKLSPVVAGVWLATGQSWRKFRRARIVSDSLRFVMLKYRDSDGVHSLGRVPDDRHRICLLYTSDAADDRTRVDSGGRRNP